MGRRLFFWERGNNPAKEQKKALVFKHLRRHKWLIEHIDVVKKFVGSDAPIEVKSMPADISRLVNS